MKQIQLCAVAMSALILSVACVYGQSFSMRSLLEKQVFYCAKGKVTSCSYWSIPLGKYPCKLERKYPGTENLPITAEINFALLSSGYIEGNGYGSKGKVGAEGFFAIKEGDSLKRVEFGDIAYIYGNGSMVKLNSGDKKELFLECEGNVFSISYLSIMVWRYDNTFKELKHDYDVNEINAFAFTKENAAQAVAEKIPE